MTNPIIISPISRRPIITGRGNPVTIKRVSDASSPGGSSPGAGPNAPSWSGKTVYTEQLFASDVPLTEDANGFVGFQGFTAPWNRVSYPTVSTPIGTKRVMQIDYPGQRNNITALDQVTPAWAFEGNEYTNGGVLVQGTWTGTLTFERSTDGGSSWSAATMIATDNPVMTAGVTHFTGTTTTVNGTWRINTTGATELLRVRASAWTSGTAIVTVGMNGGQGPARFLAGRFTSDPTRIYTRTIARVSADWSDSLSAGTKLMFFSLLNESGRSNVHYLGITDGTTVRPGATLERNWAGDPGTGATTYTGTGTYAYNQWVDVEQIAIANTVVAGVSEASDGVLKIWVNGTLVVDRSDALFFNRQHTGRFRSLFCDPTFGGGSSPPGPNQFMQIASMYRESAP